MGITGRDMLLDSGAPAEECSRSASAVPRSASPRAPAGRSVTDLAGSGSPPPTPGCSEAICRARRRSPGDHLDGAVETAIRLGVADAVADVVETGTTLRKAGLELFGEPIAALRGGADQAGRATEDTGVEQFLRRLQGVLVARDYVMMDYDIRAERIEEAIALTPGMEGPTVSPAAPRGLGRGPGHGAAQGPSGSWTSCGRSAPGPSSSPTSTPADSERVRLRLMSSGAV